MGAQRPASVRLYGALLRALPSTVLGYHASDAEDLFYDLHREVRRERGAMAAVAHSVRSIWRLALCALDTGRGSASGEPRGSGRFTQNVRYARRSILANPGFALSAVLILGVGIGATTTIFSVVDTVVLRPMPYPDAGRLVHFDNGAHNFPSFNAWRALTSFESVVAARDSEVDYVSTGFPERLPAALVSEDFFRVLGAAPHLGRLFTPSDYTSGAATTVVGYGAWLRLWGADPSLVGRTISLDGTPTVVVGVMGDEFSPPEIETGHRVDAWLPLVATQDERINHGFRALGVIGRLASGTSLETAQAEVDARQAVFGTDVPEQYVSRDGQLERVPLVSLREATVAGSSTVLLLLLGASTLMLLIACFNVASLVLARGVSRARELALRKALGAGRGQLVTLALTESVLLSLAGGALGVLLTYAGIALFTSMNPGGIPRIDGLTVDLRILTFAVAISVATGMIFGALPAWQATRARGTDALREGAASLTASRGGRRLRQGLVVAEIALALVLLVGAGLMVRTSLAMLSVDPGFEVDGLTVMTLSLDAGYTDPRRTQFTAALRETLAATPGVQSVAAGWTVPFTVTGPSRCCWRMRVVGDPALADPDRPFLSVVHPITDEYFATLRAPLAAGREFTAADLSTARPIAIVNPAAAAGLYDTADLGSVVGRSLALGKTTYEVVGVTWGVNHWGLDQDREPAVYISYAEFGGDVPFLNVVVRSSLDQSALSSVLRDTVRSIDATLPIGAITPMADRVATSVARPRFLATLFAVFAVVALVLACGGVYGSMLYAVGQRRREMGIRIALGASGSRVLGLVLKSALAIALTGVGLGLVAALYLSRLLTSLVWGIAPTDPITLASVAIALALATMAACLVPAWRAARTDPLETLRAD